MAPANLEEIEERLGRPRRSASPSESTYKRYLKATRRGCSSKTTMMFETGGKLLKEYNDDAHNGSAREFNGVYTNLARNASFKDGLPAQQLDFFEGVERREFRQTRAADDIPRTSLSSNEPDSIIFPHIAGAWKGPGRETEDDQLKQGYNGAALVYGRRQALDHMGIPYVEGHSHITTFNTDGTTLNLFAHHSTPYEKWGFELPYVYHQYQISSTNIRNSYEEFKTAWRQLRNAQDRAREESLNLRDQFEDYWKS